ncbi:hypothetical protein D9613_009201 [Agrocybe pediades]|uniref:Fungal-type protein kinase domain-containing protein n=1 Tax=Agrocybe pediades TaxID=84607 RepID=A0A8H4R5V3_9AGAR|nr:hypothetical protein D9613_009201 [Agrocybe pediades]
MAPEILHCDIGQLHKRYAPFEIPDGQVSAILSKVLENTDICTRFGKERGVFKAFSKALPDHEVIECDPLDEIIPAIVRAASDVKEFASTRKLNYIYRSCPRTLDIAELYSSVDAVYEKRCTWCDGAMPHGISQHPPPSKGSNSKIITRNIASVFTFMTKEKSECGNILDNAREVVSATVQIMNEDPRRIFSYGFTIEGFEMTLWYFCKSHFVVAGKIRLDTPDDFKKLIITFISFMFATDEEMGYDPTITVHEADEQTQFTYKLPGCQTRGSFDRFYRTVAIIDDFQSLSITGRSTRVWLVEERKSAEEDALPANDPAVRFVLKDVWLDSKAQTEKEIQDAIFEDMEEFLGNNPLPLEKAELSGMRAKHAHLLRDDEFKRYFMTIVADYKGYETPAYEVEATDSESEPETQTTSPASSEGWRGVDASKRQYRVVFQELCTEVGELGTLGEVMDVLEDILIPLELMHFAGWVHRDISCGNILAYKFPPKINDTESKDPKTGTPDFMPYEILKRDYITISDREVTLHNAQDRNGEGSDADEAMMGEQHARIAKLKMNSSDGQVNPNEDPPRPSYTVVHNPQHDIESLYWLALWTATLRVDHDASRRWARFIFQHSHSLTAERESAFKNDILEALFKQLHPDIAEPFASALDLFRTRLYTGYCTRERSDKVLDLNAYNDVYSYAAKFFQRIQTPSKWRQVKLTSPPRDPPRAKRPCPISSDSSSSSEPVQDRRAFKQSQNPRNDLKSKAGVDSFINSQHLSYTH